MPRQGTGALHHLRRYGHTRVPPCESSGTVTHEQCEGTGGTVTWTEGTVTRKPRANRVRLYATGVPLIARRLARRTGDWHETSLTHHESPPSELTALFPDLSPRLKEHTNEISRQATLRHLTVARVTVLQQPHWVYYVFPGHDTPQVRALPSRQRTVQIAGAALVALAVLVLLLRLAT